MNSLNIKSFFLTVFILVVFLVVWEVLLKAPPDAAVDPNLTEEEILLNSMVASESEKARVPTPSEVYLQLKEDFQSPFLDAGPNDKGIGLHILYSLTRVMAGFLAATLVAIPLGFVIGMSELMFKALNPFIQLLKPVSPLAWMPLALFTLMPIHKVWGAELASSAVIFICCIWPMLLNTTFGVANVRKDWIKVAETHELGRIKTAFKVILPAAAPTIITGMRISIGIAWLVIVAVEMVSTNSGIGYYVWNEWNNLNLNSIIVSILVIGIVGMILDLVLNACSKMVVYEE